MLLPSPSTSSASCTFVTRAAPATGFSAYSLSSGLLQRRSRRIASIFSGSTAACPQCCGEVCCRSCDHVTGTLRDLHWLPIGTRITYKLCTLMHASVHGAAPVYIRNMLTSVSDLPGRSHLRSAASGQGRIKRGAQGALAPGPPSPRGPPRLRKNNN